MTIVFYDRILTKNNFTKLKVNSEETGKGFETKKRKTTTLSDFKHLKENSTTRYCDCSSKSSLYIQGGPKNWTVFEC